MLIKRPHPFQPIPLLQTERLRLRPPREGDIPRFAWLYGNPEVGEFIDDLPDFNDPQAGENYYAQIKHWNDTGQGNRWMITLKGEDDLIGTVGFHRLDRAHFRVEIGYDLHVDYWRQGIMSEALHTILPWAFDQLGVNRVEAIVNRGNMRSEGLLRSLGFIQDAYMREYEFQGGQFIDVLFFSLLKREYRPR
jgi:ribosomal-protein-alanine N-acetyltransferase